MITDLQVAIRWTDSRGQEWVRLGYDEPRPRTDYSTEELDRIIREWTVRYNPET